MQCGEYCEFRGIDDVHSMSLHMAHGVTGSFQLCRASNGIVDIAGTISLFS